MVKLLQLFRKRLDRLVACLLLCRASWRAKALQMCRSSCRYVAGAAQHRPFPVCAAAHACNCHLWQSSPLGPTSRVVPTSAPGLGRCKVVLVPLCRQTYCAGTVAAGPEGGATRPGTVQGQVPGAGQGHGCRRGELWMLYVGSAASTARLAL
jgi:hypothetical protein